MEQGSALTSSAGVRAQEDKWIVVPANNADKPVLELRPGIDDDTVSVRHVGLQKEDVSIRDLRRGLKLIEEEHQR
jgi:hypothetical protein